MMPLDSTSDIYPAKPTPVHGAVGEVATPELGTTPRRRVRPLAPVQEAVARLAAEGLSNKEIAQIRGISEGAVKIHVKAAMKKLGAVRRQGFIQHFPLAGGVPRTIPTFTAREAQVLPLIAEGLSNKEIGARIGIAGETVAYHVRTTLEKIDARNRTEAARWYAAQQLAAQG
ncbi:DNA-binding CsgD family transcriptional regulator [Azospirillum agricola]|uniref:LuxR family transcriptional regulator n=1 Tax=Azospirillum agricola TaxID=1720247 RepID=UPI001AE71B92|nr:helix-turn-helix transcriptional regulator [Azospirillum agricola]MBP2230803.1 DNA-binding CsgD family transcriptional regulator [Azospirillum agricola]